MSGASDAQGDDGDDAEAESPAAADLSRSQGRSRFTGTHSPAPSRAGENAARPSGGVPSSPESPRILPRPRDHRDGTPWRADLS